MLIVPIVCLGEAGVAAEMRSTMLQWAVLNMNKL
jgi:hypothetical protein